MQKFLSVVKFLFETETQNIYTNSESL